MLMNINCSAVVSVQVHLTFDDDSVKDRVIGVGDIVDITYNDAGLKKTIEGKVLKVSCATEKPTGWYIIVDGSNTMETNAVKFCPMNILDCEIIYKASDIKCVGTPISEGTVAMIRVVDGELQFTQDGYNWCPVKLDYANLKNVPEKDTSDSKDDSKDTSSGENTDKNTGDNQDSSSSTTATDPKENPEGTTEDSSAKE